MLYNRCVGGEPRYVIFRPDDRTEVVDWMERLATDRGGWINLQPGIHPDDAPPPRGTLSLIFGSRTQPVPVCTWVPGRPGGKGDETVSIGVQHPKGTRIVPHLQALGVIIPAGWRVVQDHPRRGLVISVPRTTDHDLVLDWLVRAATELSNIPLTGEWRAAIYLR